MSVWTEARRARELRERDDLQMLNQVTEISRLRAENMRLHRLAEIQEQDAAIECDRLRQNCVGYSLLAFIVGTFAGAIAAVFTLL